MFKYNYCINLTIPNRVIVCSLSNCSVPGIGSPQRLNVSDTATTLSEPTTARRGSLMSDLDPVTLNDPRRPTVVYNLRICPPHTHILVWDGKIVA